MAVLQIRYSTVAGHTPSGLVDGQLAINLADGILFWIDNNGALKSFNFASPSVVTLGGSDSSAHAANTAFVQAAVAAVIGSAPATLNTLVELAAAINNDPQFYKSINNILSGCLRFDIAQTLNATQLGQAQANLGLSVATYDGGTF